MIQPHLRRYAAAAFASAVLFGAFAPAAHAQWWRGKKKEAPAPVGAALGSVSGKVEIQAKGSTSWSDGRADTAVNAGTKIKTGRDGAAVIAFTDGSVLEISKNSTFVFEGHSAKRVKVRLTVGFLKAWVKKNVGRRYTVRTPTSVAAIRGTEFQATVDPSGQTTWDLFSGSIDVTDNFGNSSALTPGNRMVASKATGLTEAKPIPPSVKMAPKPQVAAPNRPGKKTLKPKDKEKNAKKPPLKKRPPPPPPLDNQFAPPPDGLLPPPPDGTQQNIELAPPPEISPSSP